MTACVAAPVLHAYAAAPPGLAVSTVLVPAQICAVPAMLAEGEAFTVNCLDALAVQPVELVAVTRYVPFEPTLIEAVAAPVLHW